VPAGSRELGRPKHLGLAEPVSSAVPRNRERRSALELKFVQKVGMSLFRLDFLFLISTELFISKVKEHKT